MSPFVALALVALGAVLARGGSWAWVRMAGGSRHVKENYRGRSVVATGGAVLVLPLVAGGIAGATEGRVAVTMLWAGAVVAGLGYLDDVYGSRQAGGLLGHARELLRGRPTTGALKAAGGAVVGLVGAWTLGWRGGLLVAAGAVVALSANLANLLDLRPARTVKVWLVVAVVLGLADVPGGGEHVIVALIGGSVAFAVLELREVVMLGDVGAGLLGAVAGVAAIADAPPSVLLATLGTLVALTALSEAVSFTRIIESVAPLRWLDTLGRRP